MKTLQEREWVSVVGHKEVPGRPALYATKGLSGLFWDAIFVRIT